ncbi:MAG: acyl-CoA synthetase FdrA [Clostridiales bacterium]|nr:acyl-CoA synthetase FdrA [Clostridiales bacterium]
MVVINYVEKNVYYDSVFLMKLASKLTNIEGIDNASIGMGTPLNKDTMADLELLTSEGSEATANDLIIAIRGENNEICDFAKAEFEKSIKEKRQSQGTTAYRSIGGAKAALPDSNLAIISVAGEYAAVEGKRALQNDMNVFMFSDNVPIEDEVELKKLAQEKGLYMMGPGCGLSFINGVAIGLCSMVNRGDIGLVGASGSGIQEVMVLVHRNGFGVSHAIGTGGRDMSDEVGGITMIQGIRALEADESTKVIALISKPPSQSALMKVISVVKECKKPVVIQFINGDNQVLKENGIMYSESFDQTAEMVMELSSGKKVKLQDDMDYEKIADEEVKKFSGEQKYFRGILCGGSLTDEAQLMWTKQKGDIYSNVAFDKKLMLDDPFCSKEHTLIDIGDEIFTKGRAHVAIDPTARVNRFIKEARDKETAVIYLDFLLGYALHPDPASVMSKAIIEEKARAKSEGRHLCVVATICGSDMDPQGFEEQKQILLDAGVIVAETNSRVVNLAMKIINKLEER